MATVGDTGSLTRLVLELSDLRLSLAKTTKDAAYVVVKTSKDTCYDSELEDVKENGMEYCWIPDMDESVQINVSQGIFDITVIITQQRELYFGRTAETSSAPVKIKIIDLIYADHEYPVTYEDGTYMGSLSVAAHVLKPAIDGATLGLGRKTTIPILEYLRQVLLSFPTLNRLLRPVHRKQYEILATSVTALWLIWRAELPAMVQKHSPKTSERNDRLVASIVAAQSNALEDMVLQLHWQLGFLLKEPWSTPTNSMNNPPESILARFLDIASRTAFMVFQWSGTHPGTTWDVLQRYSTLKAMGDDRQRYIDALEGFQQQQLDFILLMYDLRRAYTDTHLPDIPRAKDTFVDFLYRNARAESQGLVKNGPYTSVFECLLGPAVQDAYDLAEHDFSKSTTFEERDALRRLITHLAQRSGKLPKALLLDKISYFRPQNGEPQPFAKGSFADVYIGVQEKLVDGKATKGLVAIKQLRILGTERLEEMQKRIRQVYLEILTSRTMEHPNIVTICGVPRAFDSMAVVTPYYRNGTTHEYLDKCIEKYPQTPLWLLNRWINDIARGMSYLHGEGLAHGDLRGVNVLVDDDERALIADFGLAVYVQGHSKNYASMRTGNLQWMAPELLDNPDGSLSSRPTQPGDVYSFSHICIELYSGDSPYPDLADESNISPAVLARELTDPSRPRRPQRPNLMSDELWKILGRLWCTSPSDRLSAAQALREVSVLDQKGP